MALYSKLESFTFFVAVTTDGADYSEVLGLIQLLNRNVRTITISHYLHGAARNHNVPKRTLINCIKRHADDIQRILDPGHFSEETYVILQFQGYPNSEVWWIQELQPLLPKLFEVVHEMGGRYLAVENITCVCLCILMHGGY